VRRRTTPKPVVIPEWVKAAGRGWDDEARHRAYEWAEQRGITRLTLLRSWAQPGSAGALW
jgi:hypothetical protein